MNLNFSDRVGRVEPSAVLAISNLASELEMQGEDAVDLLVGVPGFLTPDNITQAAKDALDAGHTSYTSLDGISELKEAITAKLRGNGVNAEADEVVITPGGKQVLFETSQTLIDDGDEAVFFNPAWASYETMVKFAGGTFSCVDLVQHDFRLEPALDEFADTVSDETKLLVVNSPSSPVGSVFSDAAFEDVRDLVVGHDIAVISDEIYERIVYDGLEHTLLGPLDGMEDRTTTTNDLSKTSSMTGWRLGCLHVSFDLITQVGKFHSHLVSCAVNFVQHAGAEALSEHADDDAEEMRQAFEDRRDVLVDLLAEHDADVATPKGVFYMMLPVDDDDQVWYEGMTQDAKVTTVPGSAFNAPGCACIFYVASEERFHEVVERLAEHDYI